MTVLIATDSFKDALPALEVCRAIERGVHLGLPSARTIVFPLGDGGEGTAAVLTHHARGRTVRMQVKDPLFRPIEASYGLSADGRTAFVEMASASGLQLLRPDERNPLRTTTFGTGEMILDAIDKGARHLILCIGGSATHDCGAGMAEALGFNFLDTGGQPVSPTGENLHRIAQIDSGGLRFDPGSLAVEVLCDVANPLYGPLGAAHVYAPQKGADEKAVSILEEGARHFAILLSEHTGKDMAHLPGAGAAGGLGMGALAFLSASLVPGAEAVLRLSHFKDALARADFLVTGEGRLDSQTFHGKLISSLSSLARERGIPVFALCGAMLLGPAETEAMGLTAAFSILNRPCALGEAIAGTAPDLESAAFALSRVIGNAQPASTQAAIPAAGKAHLFSLTKREQEVLKLIAAGSSNKQIARDLFISSQTVGVHRKNIMRKLGTNNVVALLKKGYDLGIIPI